MRFASLYDWLICGGGLVTLSCCVYFSYCCIFSPLCKTLVLPHQRNTRIGGRFNQGSLFKALIVIALATLMQVVLCIFSFSWIIQALLLLCNNSPLLDTKKVKSLSIFLFFFCLQKWNISLSQIDTQQMNIINSNFKTSRNFLCSTFWKWL